MRIHTLRLSDDLADSLERLCAVTKRSRASHIREALEQYLETMEDIEISLSRIRDPGAEWMDHDEVKRALDLD